MERQDIDALLIGALYGELTPADEARLSAHLESHPADRGALDDLKSAREKIAESRIFAAQAEPPQHISALLLQEAHRRAPKKAIAEDGERKDSWFWRFARAFALHPAMAAAAMLVVVLGVGALMYKNKGAELANRQAAPTSESTQTPPVMTVGGDGAPDNSVVAGSAAYEGAYRADLADENDSEGADQGGVAPPQEAQKQSDSAAQRWGGKDTLAKNKQALVVSTDETQPKDFESDRRKEADVAAKAAAEKASNEKMQRPNAVAAEKHALSEEDSALLDGLSSDTQAPATGRANMRGGEGGGGAANGMVVGNTAPSGTAAHVGPAPVPPTADPYAQPPPPAPAATTVAAPQAKPTAPAKAEAKADSKPTSASGAKGVATATTSRAAPPPPVATPKPPTASDKVAKTGGAAGGAGGTTTSDTKKVATQKPADKPPAQAPAPAPDPVLAWAKQQHARVIALVKNGDCKTAAQVALGVSQRAPDYYASFMASDRSLKSCKQYIDDARDREAEKSAKSRAQKRVNAEEAAPANNNVK